MNSQGQSCNSGTPSEEEEMDMRRGPWTMEEDLALVNYITKHGEGRWNSLAQFAGLKRTGKSCRLRWLNYLRPDVRRGNITLEEQLLILELHSRWGNRWSKIAQYLPGRTDNEIKNYWRTRVQKQAKQLKCDVNSKQFKDAMRYVWIPRLVERIQAASSRTSASINDNNSHSNNNSNSYMANQKTADSTLQPCELRCDQINTNLTPENCSTGASSDSVDTTQMLSDMDCCFPYQGSHSTNTHVQTSCREALNYSSQGFDNFPLTPQDGWFGGDLSAENTWSMDDIWLLEQQLCSSCL